MKPDPNAVVRLFLPLGLLATAPAHALDFTFTITGNPSGVTAPLSMFQRTWVPGDLTGVLYGLADNTNDQLPTSIRIVSGYEPVGLTQLLFAKGATPGTWEFINGPGFDVVGGTVTGGSLFLNLKDPVLGNQALVFDYAVLGPPTRYNSLAWNGSTGPVVALGNGLGAAGVSYTLAAPVPEPGPAALLALGLAALAWRFRRGPQRV